MHIIDMKIKNFIDKTDKSISQFFGKAFDKISKIILSLQALKQIINSLQTNICLLATLFVSYILVFVVMYYSPALYYSTFYTLLGKIILFSIIGLSFVRSSYYGCLVSLFVVILYFVAGEIIKTKFTSEMNNKEGFKSVATIKEGFTWSMKTINDFNTYNNKVHPKTQFNLQILQEQANQDEAEEYVKTGYWPWTDVTKKMYVQQAERLQMIRVNPIHALDTDMQIYNEQAAKQLLSWNTKEGDFIINGGLASYDPAVTDAVNDGMPAIEHQPKNIIRCMQDKNGVSKMQKTSYYGYNYFNGYKNTKSEDVLNEDIPNEMPGFAFVKGPCNPCGPLENPAEYNCPFTLNIKGNGMVFGKDDKGKKISPIWEQLWGLKEPSEEEARQFVEKMYDTSDPTKKGFYYGLATGN